MDRMFPLRYCQLLLLMATLRPSPGKENAQSGSGFLKTVLTQIQNERAELLADQKESGLDGGFDVVTPLSPLYNWEKSDTESNYLYYPHGNETLYVTSVKPVQTSLESTSPSSSTRPYPPEPDIKDDPEDLYSILFSPHNDPFSEPGYNGDNDDKEDQDENVESSNQILTLEDDKLNDQEVYQYYYFPLSKLKDIPPELAQGVKEMINKEKPIKPVPMIKMKPMPNKKVKKKTRNPVTPLFRAISMFIGTAMIFVVTILLLPRVRLVKARSLDWPQKNVNYPTNTWWLDIQ